MLVLEGELAAFEELKNQAPPLTGLELGWVRCSLGPEEGAIRQVCRHSETRGFLALGLLVFCLLFSECFCVLCREQRGLLQSMSKIIL